MIYPKLKSTASNLTYVKLNHPSFKKFKTQLQLKYYYQISNNVK